MQEVMRTNDPVLISFVEALLGAADIACLVLDQHMSVLEGSLGIIQRRIMVEADSLNQARRLLRDAGLADELRSR